MKTTKQDLMIVHNDKDYSISVCKPFLFFFKRWIPLTYQETENSDEKLLTFETFNEAENFIKNITE